MTKNLNVLKDRILEKQMLLAKGKLSTEEILTIDSGSIALLLMEIEDMQNRLDKIEQRLGISPEWGNRFNDQRSTWNNMTKELKSMHLKKASAREQLRQLCFIQFSLSRRKETLTALGINFEVLTRVDATLSELESELKRIVNFE